MRARRARERAKISRVERVGLGLRAVKRNGREKMTATRAWSSKKRRNLKGLGHEARRVS